MVASLVLERVVQKVAREREKDEQIAKLVYWDSTAEAAQFRHWCHEICFQNHPRSSFLQLCKSCQVSICSIASNYTSKIEHWENTWVIILPFWLTYFDRSFIRVSFWQTSWHTKSIYCSQVKFLTGSTIEKPIYVSWKISMRAEMLGWKNEMRCFVGPGRMPRSS